MSFDVFINYDFLHSCRSFHSFIHSIPLLIPFYVIVCHCMSFIRSFQSFTHFIDSCLNCISSLFILFIHVFILFHWLHIISFIMHSFIHSFIDSCIHSCIPSFTPSLIHFIRSVTHSFHSVPSNRSFK